MPTCAQPAGRNSLRPIEIQIPRAFDWYSNRPKMDFAVTSQPATQSYIGSSIPRREDVRFLTGRGQYLDDIRLPGMLHAAILRSPHSHARIRDIDTSAAMGMDGVVAVFTYADMAELSKPIPMRVFPLPGLENYLQTPLSADTIRHAGEAVAVVVAESRYIAEDALDLVEVDYEPLPAVTSIDKALEDSVLVHPANGTNLAGSAEIKVGDVEAAFRDADYVRREQFRTNRHTANPLETRGLLANYDTSDGHMRVWGPTKVSHTNRAILARHLEIDEERIHFIEPDVGGRVRRSRRVLCRGFPDTLCILQAGKPREVGGRPGGTPGVGQPLARGVVRC